MITRIEAYNYRCYRRLDVELGGFKVIAGANGAGKSTLLDIPSLIGDVVRTGEVGQAFFETRPGARAPRAQRAEDVVTYGMPPRTVASVAVEVALPPLVRGLAGDLLPQYGSKPWRVPNVVRYEVSVEPINDRLEIAEEFVTCFVDTNLWTDDEQSQAGNYPSRPEPGNGLVGRAEDFRAPSFRLLDRQRRSPMSPGSIRPDDESTRFGASVIRFMQLSETRISTLGRGTDFQLNLEFDRLALAEVPADRYRYPVLAWLQSFFRNEVLAYDPDPAALRFAAAPTKTDRLRGSAANLPWLLNTLASFDPPDEFEDWTLQLRDTIPGFERLEPYVREEDRHASFRVVYADGRRINASALSDGTLRLIALTAVAYVKGVPPLLIIEQPEDGVHPRGISDLVEAFRLQTLNTDGERDQVWVSTHSPILLSEVPLDDIVVISTDAERGSYAIKGSEHPNLVGWKGSINPGKLFASGVLG